VWNTDGEVEALEFWTGEDQEGEGEVRFWYSESICESNGLENRLWGSGGGMVANRFEGGSIDVFIRKRSRGGAARYISKDNVWRQALTFRQHPRDLSQGEGRKPSCKD
jgi:hypothetical protein